MWNSAAMSYLDLAIERAGSMYKLAEETGIPYATIKKWAKRDQSPSIEKFNPVMNYLGVLPRIVGQDGVEETSFLISDQDELAPKQEDFLRVMVVAEPDKIDPNDTFTPASNLYCWAMINKKFKPMRGRSQLIAVKVADKTMSPLLDPGDYVYIDQEERQPHDRGKIYLVRSPEGHVALRRVVAIPNGSDTSLTFYCDTHVDPPQFYSLNEHYEGEIKNAILGRAICMLGTIVDL